MVINNPPLLLSTWFMDVPKGATTSIVVRGSAYRHELQALFGTFHKKSYLAQYQTHFSLQSLDQMYEPPQSNVQSNIWMEKNYEHTDPYQSSEKEEST